MEKNIYIIEALSNMHVGSGDANFGVIDNLIQRDVLTDLPNINSSGLKGAIREFFKNAEIATDKEDLIRAIFGSEPKDREADSDSENPGKTKKSKKDLQQGAFRFFEANLLSIPIRSDRVPFLMATSIEIAKDLLFKSENFNIPLMDFEKPLNDLVENFIISPNNPLLFDESLDGSVIENHEWVPRFEQNSNKELLEKLFGSPLVILNDNDFRTICNNDNLPVIARNNLENGQSKNLWYEQILPRFSRFYFSLIKQQPFIPIENLFEFFDEKLKENIVQIGANATIGYGYCRIKNINTLNS